MNTTTQTLEGQASAAPSIDRALSGLRDGVAQATATAEKAQSAMRQNVEKAMKSASEMFSFAQGNFEAFARCGEALTAGMQDMARTATAATKASMEDTMHSVKAMGAAKSVKELMDLQAGLVRTTMEKTASQASKLADASMKVSEQALAPITARMSLAAATFGRIG